MSDYYSLMDEINDARSQRNYKRALQLCLEAINLLPLLVKSTKKQYGRWDIVSLPPLECACLYLTLLRRRDDLRRVRAQLEPVPELADWLGLIDASLGHADLMDKIESIILANPGTLQSGLGKALDADGRIVSNLLYHADQMGLVRREKEGRTYRLYLTEAP